MSLVRAIWFRLPLQWIGLGIWIVLYFSNWTPILNNYLAQTTVGILLFLLPGAIFTLLYFKQVKWTKVITLGFMLSSCVVLILGIVSILFNVSSQTFHLLFKLVGTTGFISLLLNRKQIQLQFWDQCPWRVWDILLLVLSITATAALLWIMTDLNYIDDDYLTYNAMVTEFADSPHMTVLDPFLGTNTSIKARLHLFGWILDQSIIVNFTQLNILQIFHHINFLLVILVQVSVYDLLKRFKVPRRFALTASIFTVFAIITQLNNSEIGDVFIHRLAQDKVMTAWIAAPICIGSVLSFLKAGNFRNGLILFVVSLTTVNFHAVIFVYIAMIAGIFVLLYVVFQSRKWRHVIYVGLIFVICAFIPFGLRLLAPDDYVYESEDILSSNQQPEHFARIVLSDDSTLVGISSNLTDGVTFLIVFGAALLALLYVRKTPLSYYLIGCVAILVAVSNPITAPLVAKVVTPFQLWRVPWLLPFGISGAFILQIAYQQIQKLSIRVANIALLLFTLYMTVSIVSLSEEYVRERIENPDQDSYSQRQGMYNDLIEVGSFIEKKIVTEKTTVFADNSIMYLIPATDARIHALIWHNGSQVKLTHEEQIERELDHNKFYADDFSESELHELLDKYDIQYLITSQYFIKPANAIFEASSRLIEKHSFGSITLWTFE